MQVATDLPELTVEPATGMQVDIDTCLAVESATGMQVATDTCRAVESTTRMQVAKIPA